MAQEHPTAAAMDSFIGCRLRSLKPSKPSNSSKSLPNSAGKRHPTAAAIASFIGVQGCHLPGLKVPNAAHPRQVRPAPQGKGTPTRPRRATPACKTPNFAGNRFCCIGRSRLPFARLQTLPNALKMPRRPFVLPSALLLVRPCLGTLNKAASSRQLPHAKLCGRQPFAGQPLLFQRCNLPFAWLQSVCCLANPTLQANATSRPPQWRQEPATAASGFFYSC